MSPINRYTQIMTSGIQNCVRFGLTISPGICLPPMNLKAAQEMTSIANKDGSYLFEAARNPAIVLSLRG